MKLTICSWNVHSLVDEERRKKFFLSLSSLGGDINLIQETWLGSSTHGQYRGWKGPNIWSDFSPEGRRAGVAILCRNWVNKLNPVFQEIIPGRAAVVTINTYCGTTISIICYYSSCNQSIYNRMKELKSMDKFITENTIIGGDFNSTDDPISPTGKPDHALEQWSTFKRLDDIWVNHNPHDQGFTFIGNS